MQNTTQKFFIFLAAVIVFTATSVYAQRSHLLNTSWKLTEANGLTVTKSSAFIAFSENGTSFTGSTGCNRIFGNVNVSGRNIDLRNIGSTKMMCKQMAGNVAEHVYLKVLNDAKTFRINGRNLRLSDRRGHAVLKFKRTDDETTTATVLDSKKWVLESIKGRQTFVPLPNAFIKFDSKKGSAGGDTSCNVFGGSYKASGNSIKFSDMISTMRACIEDGRMSVERELLDGLRQSARFEIDGNRLRLFRSKELLLTFRGESK